MNLHYRPDPLDLLPFRRHLIERLKLTWLAWKASARHAPIAVIYDEGPEDNPGLEEYYGFFHDRVEAERMFNGLGQPLGYNPKLVLILDDMPGKEQLTMERYDIYRETRSRERYSVTASSPEEALRLYESGEANLRDDEVQDSDPPEVWLGDKLVLDPTET